MTGKYIAFDSETTGIHTNCNLLTISFIILDKYLNKIDKLNLSLKQTNGYFVYPEALTINKIDLVKHHNTSLELLEARKILSDFLQKNKSQFNLIPIGHNIHFDIKFLKSSGLLPENEYINYISYNPIDTISIAQFLKLCGKLPEKQSISLINLCKYSKLNNPADSELEHSSEYDINMTIKLLKIFKELTCETENDTLETNFLKKRQSSSK